MDCLTLIHLESAVEEDACMVSQMRREGAQSSRRTSCDYESELTRVRPFLSDFVGILKSKNVSISFQTGRIGIGTGIDEARDLGMLGEKY